MISNRPRRLDRGASGLNNDEGQCGLDREKGLRAPHVHLGWSCRIRAREEAAAAQMLLGHVCTGRVYTGVPDGHCDVLNALGTACVPQFTTTIICSSCLDRLCSHHAAP